MTTANAIPQPLPGEIQVDYYSRVFSLLDGETDEKNAAILAAWDQSEEARKLDGIAAKKFPVEKFSRGSMVPVFTEHTTVRRTVDANGNQIEEPVVWDRDRLAAMCYQMNHRIRDTGSFSPITEGHTPDKFARDKGCPQPAVLGYQGKFRMGLIGNIDPKWTIFCDEYRHAEDAEKFQKLTRRSPEVWTAAEKPFFDPCAALGAETPRLDMGTSLAYSREGYWQSIGDDGAEVDKYSMGVATFPGPGNVSMPEHVKVKDNYEAGQDPDGDEAGDDVNQIIEAVMNALQPVIEQFQILQPMIPTLQKLAVGAELPEKPDNAGAAPPAGTAAPAAEGDKVAAPAAPVQKPAEPNPQPHVAGHQPPPVAPEAKPQVQPQELADDDKAMMVKYMAGQCSEMDLRAHRDKKKPAPTPVAQQSAAASPYSRLSAEEQQARYEKLNAMRDKGYEFDVEPELRLTANYSREQFDNHVNIAMTRYSRLPIGGRNFPTLESDPLDSPKSLDQVTAEDRDAVTRYALAHNIDNFAAAFAAMKEDASRTAATVR